MRKELFFCHEWTQIFHEQNTRIFLTRKHETNEKHEKKFVFFGDFVLFVVQNPCPFVAKKYLYLKGIEL
ncbi:MAG: hypothetical protein BWK80_16460 [Desulfobacteraceae bacterium IS3]|nr:MAG: hypothetical protein BWK80_16460 [Desulfobacteraceae bacterium IS3]